MNPETAAKALVQYSACLAAMGQAEMQIQHGPGENKAFWFRVQLLLGERMRVHENKLKSVLPSGFFNWLVPGGQDVS